MSFELTVTNSTEYEQHQAMIISSLQNMWNNELDANKALLIECQLRLVYISPTWIYTHPPWLEHNIHKFGLTNGVTLSTRCWSTTIHGSLHQCGNSTGGIMFYVFKRLPEHYNNPYIYDYWLTDTRLRPQNVRSYQIKRRNEAVNPPPKNNKNAVSQPWLISFSFALHISSALLINFFVKSSTCKKKISEIKQPKLWITVILSAAISMC